MEDLALDGLLVGLQEVHRAVRVLQRQALGARDVDLLLEPLLPAVQLGARCSGAISHHREQRAFDIEAQATRVCLRTDDLVDAQTLPQRQQHVDLAVGPRSHESHDAVPGAHDFLGRAAAQDAGGQLAQALDNCRIIGGGSCRPRASRSGGARAPTRFRPTAGTTPCCRRRVAAWIHAGTCAQA